MSNFTIELADVEGVIEREIKAKMTQGQIAQTYAMAIVSSWPTDWFKVNTMIVKRWSQTGLVRVKEMAWKIVEEKRKQAQE